jgi:hypothetical protein
MRSIRRQHGLRWRQNCLRLPQRIREIRELLSSLPAGSQDQFLFQPKANLGGLTPIQSLRRGSVAEVRTAALGHRDR